MRTRHWLAALMSGCLALAGMGTASAQPPQLPSNGNPDEVGFGMLPSPYNTAYGPAQPYYSGMNSAGYPPGANPWPGVSPYMGPPVDSTRYEDGFWFNRIMQGNRQFYFSVEAVFGHSSKPGTTLIGAPMVNPQTAEGVAGITGGTTTTTTTTGLSGLTQFNQAPGGTGPVISIGATGGNGNGNGSTGGSAVIFGSQNTGVLADTLDGMGMRGTWGWWNADDTGLIVSGFYQQRSTTTFSLVDPQLVIDPNNANFNPLLHLHAWFGLPLGGADTDGTSLNGAVHDGAVIPYDMGVNVSFSSRLAGANTDWYFNSVYERGKVKVRPFAGAKYIRLQEDFLFDAYDSGLGYTVNNTATSGGGGTGSTTSLGAGFLTPSALQAGFTIPNIIHSRLDSRTLADMAGPEIGFRVDMGGKKFQLWTHTKVGALANVTQRQVSGFGIGNAFNIITGNTIPVMPNDPSKTQFSNSQTITTMSPMFEQQINCKFPLFGVVPYLNRLEILERAQLTGGYTFLFLGDVYRPQNAIIWNQWPNTPQLNSQKSNFYNSMFNVGIEWTY